MTVWDGEPPLSGTLGQIHQLAFEPDDRGRLSKVTENGGATAEYTYDENGRIRYVHDFPTADTSGTPVLSVNYEWEDDPRPRLSQMVWRVGAAVGSGAIVAQIEYTPDHAGHRTELKHLGDMGDRAIFYASDDTYRLLREIHQDGDLGRKRFVFALES